MPRKIITRHVYPPIPVRSMDWIAYFDGSEGGLQGEGATEQAAIDDLMAEVQAGLESKSGGVG
jgi:hypothetical protein